MSPFNSSDLLLSLLLAHGSMYICNFPCFATWYRYCIHRVDSARHQAKKKTTTKKNKQIVGIIRRGSNCLRTRTLPIFPSDAKFETWLASRFSIRTVNRTGVLTSSLASILVNHRSDSAYFIRRSSTDVRFVG
jgi:hypothetical protein